MIKARAIVMGMRRRNGPAARTTRRFATVLAERPCRVIVVSEGGGRSVDPSPSAGTRLSRRALLESRR